MIRIAPFIAQRASLSRRQAEQAILQGRVSRHGDPITSFCVETLEGLALDGIVLPEPPQPKAWIYHKPAGQLVTRHDPQGRPTVWSTLRHHFPDGPLVCVGRLDALSEGLLIVTNHPPLAHVLETSRQPRVYRVWVDGAFASKSTAILRKGIVVDDVQYRPIRVRIEQQSPEGSQLCVTLTEGKKREIRIVMDALGHPVTRLLRLSFGPWSLLDQDVGAIREVSARDVEDMLRQNPESETQSARSDRPAYSDRPARSDRPAYRGHTAGSSSARPSFGPRTHSAERPARSDRPFSSPRPQLDRSDARSDRPAYSDRPARSDRPAYRGHTAGSSSARPSFGPRTHSAERPARSDRPFSSPRPQLDRSDARSDRPAYSDRPARSDRPAYRGHTAGSSSARPSFGPRTHSAERPARSDRPFSSPRPQLDRSDARSDRPAYRGHTAGSSSARSPSNRSKLSLDKNRK